MYTHQIVAHKHISDDTWLLYVYDQIMSLTLTQQILALSPLKQLRCGAWLDSYKLMKVSGVHADWVYNSTAVSARINNPAAEERTLRGCRLV
jgi:hypothetical protein